jgi:hypothetical protein
MLFAFLLVPLLSLSISTDAPWFKILDPKSPEYFAQLYCGTVARGRVTIELNKMPVDYVGFAQGVEEIIRYSKADPAPVLNDEEVSWLTKETSSVLGDWILGKTGEIEQFLSKFLLDLKFLKTTKDKKTTLASLLHDAKHRRLFLVPEKQAKDIKYLKTLPKSPDGLCENLRELLIRSVENPVIIPDLKNKSEIKKAIQDGLTLFDEKDKENYMISHYALAQYLEFEKTKSPDSLTRFFTALEMLWDLNRIHFYDSRYLLGKKTETTQDMRVILASLLKLLNDKGIGNTGNTSELLKSLNLDEIDRKALNEYLNGKITYIFSPRPLQVLAHHLIDDKNRDYETTVFNDINKKPLLKNLCPAIPTLWNFLKARIDMADKNKTKI